MEFLLAFTSTHKALKAESVLKADDIPFRLDPAPRELSTYCDLVIRVTEAALDRAVTSLEGAGAGAKSVYRIEEQGYVKV